MSEAITHHAVAFHLRRLIVILAALRVPTRIDDLVSVSPKAVRFYMGRALVEATLDGNVGWVGMNGVDWGTASTRVMVLRAGADNSLVPFVDEPAAVPDVRDVATREEVEQAAMGAEQKIRVAA